MRKFFCVYNLMLGIFTVFLPYYFLRYLERSASESFLCWVEDAYRSIPKASWFATMITRSTIKELIYVTSHLVKCVKQCILPISCTKF